MKNTIYSSLLLVLAIVLVSNLIGCAALKKKFTPKRKAKPKETFFTKVKKYDVKPSLKLYEKHYIFWLNWHKKLISELGENRKSDMRSIQEMIDNLDDMAAILVDEKANYLKHHIDELKKAKQIMEERTMTTLNETRIRRIVERQYRNIRREFLPKKMAGFIRKDWR